MDKNNATDNGNPPVIEDMFTKPQDAEASENASAQLDDDVITETEDDDTDGFEDDMTVETEGEDTEVSEDTAVAQPVDPLIALEERYNSGDPLSGLDIPRSTNLISKCSAANNRSYNISMEDFCRNSIYTGFANNALKVKLRKEKKGTWKAHAKANFSDISIRTMQKQMKLAKFEGILNHTRFGFEGLYLFVSWLDGRKGKDPIKGC